MSTYNLCFEQIYEKYLNFLSKYFHFLVVKFSVYLNRHVFMSKQQKKLSNQRIHFGFPTRQNSEEILGSHL